MPPKFSQFSDAPGLMQTNCLCLIRGALRILQSDVVLPDQFLQSQDTGISCYQVGHFSPFNNRVYPVLDEAPSSDRPGFAEIHACNKAYP
jgi:hypothetical protein